MTLAVSLPLPLLDQPLRCAAQQCAACPLRESWCGGWETCCGGGFAEGQQDCRGACDECLGMYVHRGTWNVCGKPQAALRNTIEPKMPWPSYQVPMYADLPLYVPVLTRLPRGPMRDLPQLPFAGITVQDLRSRRQNSAGWLRYVRNPILLASEQDHVQHDYEGWHGRWVRMLRAKNAIWLATNIEFSCYADDGNFAHFWSIQRALRSANAAQAEIVGIPPITRLRVDDLAVAWLTAVPNLFLPFPALEPVQWRRLNRWVEGAGGWDRVRVVLLHAKLTDLHELPDKLRRRASWFDQAAWSTALAGGLGQANKERDRVQVFLRESDRRRKIAERILRGPA